MTGYDVFALLVVLFSALAGWVRGGAREIITFFSFVLAALIALIGLPYTGPWFRGFVDPDWVGSLLAAVLSFLAVYFAIRLLGAWASHRLRQTERLGGVDRAVGVLFGLLRAMVLLGVIHLVFHAATPPERVPGWFRDAAVFPVSAAGARLIQAVLPGIGRGADALTPTVTDSVRRGVREDSPATPTPQSDSSAPAS